MSDRTEVAVETAKRLFGVTINSGSDSSGPGTGDIGRIFAEQAFVDSWTRTALDDLTRSLITVAILATSGATDELRRHLHGALHLGATPEQLEDLSIQVGVYAGIPRGNLVWDLAQQVIASRRKAAAGSA